MTGSTSPIRGRSATWGEASDAPGTADACLPLTGERTVPGIAAENYWFPETTPVYDLR